METITQVEVMPEKKSYLARFKDFMRNKKTQIAGTVLLGGSLLTGGCMSFGALEARVQDDFRYGSRYSSGGEQVEFITRVLQPDYEEESSRLQEFNPLLEVVEGEYAGLKIRLREIERRGNRDALDRARELTNNDYLTKENRFIRITGEVERKFQDLWDINPEFLSFSIYDEEKDRMILEDTVYTDIDTTDIGWMGHYRAYYRALDLWGWGSPFGHGCWSSMHYWNIYAWDDWDHDGIPNIVDSRPFENYWNPYWGWGWFNIHNHHRFHFEHDGHGGYRPKPIVIRKNELTGRKGIRIINKDSLTPGNRVVDRIKSGEINLDRAVRKSDGSYDGRAIKGNDGSSNSGAVKRSGSSKNDGSRAVKKNPPKTYQPVPPPPATKQGGSDQGSGAAEKKKDDEGRPAFNSRYSGSKDYSTSNSSATRSSTQIKYAPRSTTPINTRSYGVKQEVKKFNFPDLSKYRTPVYKSNSSVRSSNSGSKYSAPVVRRSSSSSSGAYKSSSGKSSYTQRSSSTRSSSSSSSSSGTAAKKDKG